MGEGEQRVVDSPIVKKGVGNHDDRREWNLYPKQWKEKVNNGVGDEMKDYSFTRRIEGEESYQSVVTDSDPGPLMYIYSVGMNRT